MYLGLGMTWHCVLWTLDTFLLILLILIAWIGMCYIFCFPPPIEMFLVTMSGLYDIWLSWGPEEFGLGIAVIAVVQTEYLY